MAPAYPLRRLSTALSRHLLSLSKGACVPVRTLAVPAHSLEVRSSFGHEDQKDPKWYEIYTTDPIDREEKTFSKILIANRGEIACRIIRTCKRMGIKTVAIHSDVDSNALHVRMADESVCVGAAPSAHSYLNMDAIVGACLRTGAEAVHPGFGFLSENTKFAGRLEREGIVFIGPNSQSIVRLGDKLESKRIARKAQVNGIPGYDGEIRDVAHCLEIANQIGYPVMIKASAGGGGKGMRVAWNDNEVREGFHLSREEAAASFGDDRMLVEKYVAKPRHIEMQLLADKHGNAVYLNERECSIQRRNQKVIEEAPSPFLDPATRKAMGEQAVALAKAVQYWTAGTVEFLVDKDKNFYFLEMNTRLQVEHPISECITGLDIVHQMIRISYGHALNVKQADIPIRGWAVESRIYAENPYKSFGTPSVGRLHMYQEPSFLDGVRCESGVTEGSEISVYYDPMICKLVTYAKTRKEAIDKQVQALDNYVIRGVSHNLSLLRCIMTEPKYVAGDITTAYLPETFPDGFRGYELSNREKDYLFALSACIQCMVERRAQQVVSGHDFLKPSPTEFDFAIHWDDEKKPVHLKLVGHEGDFRHPRSQLYRAYVGSPDNELNLRCVNTLADRIMKWVIDGKEVTFQVIHRSATGRMRVRIFGSPFNLRVLSERADQLWKYMPTKHKIDTSNIVIAPMPGQVVAVLCEEGDKVGENQELCILEAMKMQNALNAPIAGTVKKVNVKQGDAVEEEQVLIELEPHA